MIAWVKTHREAILVTLLVLQNMHVLSGTAGSVLEGVIQAIRANAVISTDQNLVNITH
jgi:hypothetical protein